MRKLLKKEQILTLPNLLSLFRLALIPVIVWQYNTCQNYAGAVAFILLSGATDILDGFIARKFHMVSDFGKILDPIADKLTQAALIACLLRRYYWLRWLMVLFIAKEIAMAVTGFIVMQRKQVVNSAQWFGKLATVMLYATMVLLFLLPDMPLYAANVLILLCAGAMLLSLTKYLLFYWKLLKSPGGTT